MPTTTIDPEPITSSASPSKAAAFSQARALCAARRCITPTACDRCDWVRGLRASRRENSGGIRAICSRAS